MENDGKEMRKNEKQYLPPFCQGINDRKGDESFAALLGLRIFTAREQQSREIVPLPDSRQKE